MGAEKNMTINKQISTLLKGFTTWKISNLFDKCVYANGKQNVVNKEEAMKIQVRSPLWTENIRGVFKKVFEWSMKRLVNV